LGTQTTGARRRDESASGQTAKRLPNATEAVQSSAERENGGPLAGLMSLLGRFKAARRRRDDAQYGSASWLDADGEITSLQREIFTLPIEDRPTNVYRYEPDDDVEDEDRELGQAGGRAAH
jgi:hypothetical protein